MRKFTITLLLFAASLVNAYAACDSVVGNRLYDESKSEEAYEMLKDCASVSRLSGDTYGKLAFLIARGFGTYQSRELRSRTAFSLFMKSAINGSSSGLDAVVSVFEYGEPTIHLEKDPAVVNCLKSAGARPSGASDVYRCIPSSLLVGLPGIDALH